MTRRRLLLGFVWLALAAAVLALVIYRGEPLTIGTAVLAWFGGIVSVLLHDEVRSRRDARV